MALSCVVSEIFNVEKYRYLEIPVKGQSRSLIVVPFDRLGMVSDAPFLRYSTSYAVTLKTALVVRQGH